MKTLNRRIILRGMGGTAIALPFLQAMMPSRARAQDRTPGVGKNGRPQRFLLTATQSGQGPGWFDNKTGADGLVLGPVLAPLANHRKDLILIDGISNMAAIKAGNQGHDAQGTFTTAMARGQGISIDQEIAKAIGGGTKFKSLQFAVWPGGNYDYLSWAGKGLPLAPTADPQKGFTQIFSDFKTDPLVFERAKAQRKSILDHVQASYQQVVARLGGEDLRKMQAHLDGIREVELRIGKLQPTQTNSCSAPTITALKKNPDRSDPPEHWIDCGRLHNELVVMAFACDLTRVASINWGNNVTNGPDFPWVAPGMPGLQWHGWSHGVVNLSDAYPNPLDIDNNTKKPGVGWNAGSKWLAGYFAGLLDRYKAIDDGPGKLFDNMLFYLSSEVSSGNHTNHRETVLVAGNAGGYLKTNQRIDLMPQLKLGGGFNEVVSGVGTGELFVSFLNAFGIPATKFGDPNWCRGALPSIAA